MSTLEVATHAMLPAIALSLGLGGSLHCAGMCGPLVVSVAPTKLSNILYQSGRLLGYLFLCLVVSIIGQSALKIISPQLQLLSTVVLGIAFLLVGLALLSGKGLHAISPKWSSAAFSNSTGFFRKRLPSNQNALAFGVGLSSIFLPCALLYGIIFTLIASHGLKWAMLSILLFWLGTLPAMLLGPQIFRKVLGPLSRRAPRFAGSLCVVIGLATLFYRFYFISLAEHSCH